MLKLFYKTLLVSFISGSLLLLDFSYKGSMININSVQAETLKTDEIKDGSNIMATLTMTAVGLLASRLYKAKMTTDIMLAAAGGAMFIAGDIMAVFKNKEVIKDLETQITRNDDGKIDQKQIETIEKLKQSYMAAKDTATTKKNLQMAAAAAFAAAGISAYMMAATETSLAATCALGINAGIAASVGVKAICNTHTTSAATHMAAFNACCSASGGCCPSEQAESMRETAEAAACNKEETACTAKLGVDSSLVTTYLSTREVPSPSASALAADTSKATAIETSVSLSPVTCSKYASTMATIEAAGQCGAMAALGNAQNSGAPPIALGSKIDLQKILYPNQKLQLEDPKTYITSNYFEKILNMAFPVARADLFSPLGIASALAIKFVLATSTTLSTTLDLNLLIPKRRAIAWGILSGLSFAASTATGAELEKIQSNIDRIDAILNSMYALKNGVATANNTSVSNPKVEKTIIINNRNLSLNDMKNQDIDLKANGGPGSLPCITGNNPDNCPIFSSKLNAQVDVKSMPDFVQAQIGSIAKLTDGINGKSRISASSLDQAQVLAGQQNALRNELLKQQKLLQGKLSASGSKTDLAKDSAKLEADLKAAVQKELDSNKTTARAMLASFSHGSSSAIATDANKNVSSKPKNAFNKVATTGNVPAAISTSASLKADSADLNDDLKDKKSEEAKAVDGATATASMDDYALKNDITQDKDSSIFELISNRYQKSYEKLFKRVK